MTDDEEPTESIHPTHVIEVSGWSAGPVWYEKSHCSRCGLHVEDERIEKECPER
jgi:hypothetical protein